MGVDHGDNKLRQNLNKSNLSNLNINININTNKQTDNYYLVQSSMPEDNSILDPHIM